MKKEGVGTERPLAERRGVAKIPEEATTATRSIGFVGHRHRGWLRSRYVAVW
jgi:hypothetical protein